MDTKQTPTINATPADKSFWRRFRNLSWEIWHDQDLQIRLLAAKGGASAVVVACVLVASYAVSLPFLLAAVVIAACGGLVALGLCGLLLGSATAWNSLKKIYSKTFPGNASKPLAQPKKSLHQRITGHPRVRRLIEKPLMQKFLNSRTWKTARLIARKQQDLFLTGMAGGGSVFLGTMGALTLITQVVLLPVIAVGSLITFTTVVATGGVVSGACGVYLSGQKFGHMLQVFRDRKKARAAKILAASPPQPATKQLPAPDLLGTAFTQAAESSPGIQQAPAVRPPPITPAPPPY